MSAVYILAWLGFAVGVGWFVVWLDEKCHELDRTINEVLDAQETCPSCHGSGAPQSYAAAVWLGECVTCDGRGTVKSQHPDPTRDRTGAAS
jgi:DnaJ-class molecular chaperone